MALPEREFVHQKPETKPASFACPKCHRDDYQIRWILRTKKERIPPGADERDRALFGRLRDFLIRVDDSLVCRRASGSSRSDRSSRSCSCE